MNEDVVHRFANFGGIPIAQHMEVKSARSNVSKPARNSTPSSSSSKVDLALSAYMKVDLITCKMFDKYLVCPFFEERPACKTFDNMPRDLFF